jgi:FlaA1/EpsC-like NDP-sugar epimerase
MIKRYSTNFALFSICSDWLLTFCALWLVLHIEPRLAGFPGAKQEGPSYLLIPTIWVLVNLFISLYDNKRNIYFVSEVMRLLGAAVMASLTLAGIAFFIEHHSPRSVFVVFILIGAFLQLIWRMGIRVYWRVHPVNGQALWRVLILGAGETGQKVASTLYRQGKIQHPIIRYLDDDLALSLLRHTTKSLKQSCLFVHNRSMSGWFLPHIVWRYIMLRWKTFQASLCLICEPRPLPHNSAWRNERSM